MPYGDSLSPEDCIETLHSKPLPRKALHAVLFSLLQQAQPQQTLRERHYNCGRGMLRHEATEPLLFIRSLQLC